MTWEKMCKALAKCCGSSNAEDTPEMPANNPPPARAQTLVVGAAAAGAGRPATLAVANPPVATPATSGAVVYVKSGHTYKDSTAELLFNLDRNRDSVTDVPVGASAPTVN